MHVRVDEDEHVAGGVAGSGVARAADARHGLVNHGRAPIARDGRRLIRAVVVDHDDFDGDAHPCPQVVRRGPDRVEGGRKPGFLVVGGGRSPRS